MMITTAEDQKISDAFDWVAEAKRVCAGMELEDLQRLPDGALARAYDVCSALVEASEIAEGFDLDEDVSGADLVDVVAEQWANVRCATGTWVASGQAQADEANEEGDAS